MEQYKSEDVVSSMDSILLAVLDGEPIPTDPIDRLPPWRARVVVTVALLAGGTLEHGDPQTFGWAAVAAARQDPGQAGWWRRALGLEPRWDLTPRRCADTTGFEPARGLPQPPFQGGAIPG
jgi:hypothetical protein